MSEALKYAGENACYETFQENAGSLFMLGAKSKVVRFVLQTWLERLDDLVAQRKMNLALEMIIDIYRGSIEGVIGLPPIGSKSRKERVTTKASELVSRYLNETLAKTDHESRYTYGKKLKLPLHFYTCFEIMHDIRWASHSNANNLKIFLSIV